MKRALFTIAALVLVTLGLSAQSRSAELTDKDIPVSAFNSIDVSDSFDVTVSRGSYGVRLTVDKNLAPYVEIYVKAKTLYLSYDEKAVPKDIKKMYNKRKDGLSPMFRVVVYTPELQSVSLSDNATFSALEEFMANQFELSATGKALVKNLSVTASSAKVSLKKNAAATVSLRTERGVEVFTENNANLKMTFSGNELALNAEGSSVVVAEGSCLSINSVSSGSSQISVISNDTEKVDLNTEGSSKVTLTGKATEMTVKGSRNSSVDAFSMPVETVEATLSNSASVTVNVSKLVTASLIGGSSLYYSGMPEFQIRKIVKSTLAPYGTK